MLDIVVFGKKLYTLICVKIAKSLLLGKVFA